MGLTSLRCIALLLAVSACNPSTNNIPTPARGAPTSNRSQSSDPRPRDEDPSSSKEKGTRPPLAGSNTNPLSTDELETGSGPNRGPTGADSTLDPVTIPDSDPTTQTPQGCRGTGTATTGDLVLFQGESLNPPNQNILSLTQDWRADEAWDNGQLGVESVGNVSAIRFGNTGVYHGFKLTPASVNGARKNFTLTGAEVYVQLRRASPSAPLPTFGLRVIKPGEFEGNGGAPTTTWMLDNPNGGSRFFTIPNDCSLITLQMPTSFLTAQSVGNRLIWEMQSNWSPADQLLIRKIVLKGFRFIP